MSDVTLRIRMQFDSVELLDFPCWVFVDSNEQLGLTNMDVHWE